MPPSSHLPGSRRSRSSFCSVDWLSQSSCAGPIRSSRPTEVSWGGLAAPIQGPDSEEFLQTAGSTGLKTPDLCMRGTPVAGLGKEQDPRPAPRIRTAFTAVQVSTLESSFQHRQYLGPQERKKLAKEMQLSEVQIKTWFQNRRMKHKRQMQDSQLNVPFPAPLYTALALCPPPSPLDSGLQLLYSGGPLPGPQTLVLPPGSFWGSCHVEEASLALSWASCGQQPPVPCFPESEMQTLGPSFTGGPWHLAARPLRAQTRLLRNCGSPQAAAGTCMHALTHPPFVWPHAHALTCGCVYDSPQV